MTKTKYFLFRVFYFRAKPKSLRRSEDSCGVFPTELEPVGSSGLLNLQIHKGVVPYTERVGGGISREVCKLCQNF